MSHTVKGALLIAGLMFFVGSVSALNVNDYERCVLKPGEIILAHNVLSHDSTHRQLIGGIDADVLDWNHGLAASLLSKI